MTVSFTQHTARVTRQVVAVSIVLLALTACSAPDRDNAPAEQTPTGSNDGSDGTTHEELTAERPVEWYDYQTVSDTSIQLFFFAGSEHCYGVRSQVHETPERIEVAVIEGELPDAPDVCTLEAREATLVVELDAPIGQRDVVELTNPSLY